MPSSFSSADLVLRAPDDCSAGDRFLLLMAREAVYLDRATAA